MFSYGLAGDRDYSVCVSLFPTYPSLLFPDKCPRRLRTIFSAWPITFSVLLCTVENQGDLLLRIREEWGDYAELLKASLAHFIMDVCATKTAHANSLHWLFFVCNVGLIHPNFFVHVSSASTLFTPLKWAIQNNNFIAAKILLNTGASVSYQVPDIDGGRVCYVRQDAADKNTLRTLRTIELTDIIPTVSLTYQATKE